MAGSQLKHTVVFIPFALAILVALLLTPAVTFLEHHKLPRSLSISLVVIALIAFALFALWQASPQFVNLTNNLPAYENAVREKIRVLKGQNFRNRQRSTV